MHILFVAPSSNLSNLAELPRMAGGNQITVLDGNVDRAKLELALAHEQYDAVHFAQHGDRGILGLSDGAIEVGELVTMLRAQRALRLIVLNACQTAAVATEVHNALHVPTVYMDASIDDDAAVRFSETFYRNYRATGDPAAAREAGVNALLRLYPGQATIPQLINGDTVTNDRLEQCMHGITDTLAQLDRRMAAVEGQLVSLGKWPKWATYLLAALGLLIVEQGLTPVFNALLMSR